MFVLISAVLHMLADLREDIRQDFVSAIQLHEVNRPGWEITTIGLMFTMLLVIILLLLVLICRGKEERRPRTRAPTPMRLNNDVIVDYV